MSAKTRVKENMAAVIDEWTEANIPEFAGDAQKLDMQMCFCSGMTAMVGFFLANVDDIETFDSEAALVTIMAEVQKDMIEKNKAPKIQLIT